MSAEPQSMELARREASEALERPLPYMSDGEVAAAYRTAKALADSGMFKDARQPGQAFAKMLAGRDLGLTPFESMSALHVIEGKIEAGADLHATRVRSREGYDYRVWWLRVADEWDGKPDDRGRLRPPRDMVEAVPSEDEDPADLRDYFGCVIEFTVGGERRGVARWTLEDSRVSGLLARNGPNGGPGNHVKFPRSMYFARAMSQGVSLHVPEVMGGLRIYAPGELGKSESGEDLAAGTGQAPAMDGLPTAVEAVIARARELGHAGLANRERWATVAAQPAEQVGQAVARATRELNAHAARQRRGEPEAAPEPPDADVVRCSAEDPHRGGVTCELDPGHEGAHRAAGQTWDPFLSNEGAESAQAQNEAVSAPEDAQAPEPTPDPVDGAQAQSAPAQADESGEVVDAQPVHAPEHAAEHVAALEQRMTDLAERLEAAKVADPGSEEVAALNAELDAVEIELDAATNAAQGSLGL